MTVIISVSLPDDIAWKLGDIETHSQLTRSAIVRMGILAFFERYYANSFDLLYDEKTALQIEGEYKQAKYGLRGG